MKNEITRKSVLTKALEMDFTEDEKAVITKMIASLDKRNGKTGVSEKVQVERQAERDAIMDALLPSYTLTATEIAKKVDMSVQKTSARLKELVGKGFVTKTEAKGKNPATFTVAEVEDEEE